MARFVLREKLSGFVLVVGLFLVTAATAHAEGVAVAIRPNVQPGDILVCSNGPGPDAAVVRVDPATGQQGVVSSGNLLTSLRGLALEPSGTILVIDDNAGLVRIDPVDGTQSVVSAGPFTIPLGVAVEATGTIVAASYGGLLRLDPVSGEVLRTFPAGEYLDFPAAVTVEPNGRILVGDVGFFAGTPGQVVAIDPDSGVQTLISDGGQLESGEWEFFQGIARDRSGAIFVTDGLILNNVIAVDPGDGGQRLVTADDKILTPGGIGISGNFLVVASSTGAVVKVDPVTGSQEILSSGGYLGTPAGLAVVNHPPGISPIVDIVVPPGTTVGPLAFQVGDLETDIAELSLRVASSEQAVLKDDDILLGGSGSDRTVTLSPVAGIAGTTVVSLSLGDGLATTTRTFRVSMDGAAPAAGSVAINGGAAVTGSAAVTLSLAATDDTGVTAYYLSDAATAPAADAPEWTAVTRTTSYAATVPYILAPGSGSRTVHVWFKDGAGNISSMASASIMLDGGTPTAVAVTINDGATITGTTAVTLSLSAADDTGVTAYWLSASSTVPAADAPGWTAVTSVVSFHGAIPYTLAAGSGTRTVHAWFRDSAGNVSPMASDSIMLDGDTPTAAAVVIDGGAAVTDSAAVTLSLSATDDTGVTAYYLSTSSAAPAVDAPEWTAVTSTTSYTATVPYTLAPGSGSRTVHGWFRDGVGNVSAMASDTIVMDLGAPVFSGIFPADGSWVNGADILLGGTVLDPDAGSVTLLVNGVPVPVAVDGTFSRSLTLGNGANPIELVATDALGNERREQIIINLDTIIPYLELSTLPDGSHTDQDTLNITGLVLDRDGIQSVLVGGEPVMVLPDGSFAATVPLLLGENIIEITVVDTAGNQTTISRTVIRDPALPAVVVVSPADAEHTVRPYLDVSGGAASGAVVSIVDALGNAVTVARDDGSFSGTVNLVAGLNTILITATDPATGLSNTVKRTVFYDPHAPGLALTAPPADITIKNGATVLAGVVSDALTELTVTVDANGGTFTPAVNGDGAFSQPLSFAEEGIYPVVVTVRDLNGASTSVQRTIIYSRGIVVIARGAASTGTTTVTVGLDYYPSATKMQFLLDGRAWTALETFTPTKKLTLPAGDGQKRVTVRFLDGEGSPTAYYSDTIALDTRFPKGSLAINGGDAITTSANVSLSLAVSDTNGDVRMQFSDNGSTWPTTWLPFAPSMAYRLAGSGSYGAKKVYVRFRDGAGRVSPAVSDTIRLAESVPAGTPDPVVTIKDGGRYTTTPAVAVTINPPAGGSYTQMAVSIAGGPGWTWESLKSPRSVTLPAGDGVKTVYVKFRTAAPHEESPVYSDSIILDTRPPTGSIQINGGAYTTNRPKEAVVSLAASDLNGVTDMQFSTDGTWNSSWVPFASSYPLPLRGEGVKSVKVKFRDATGRVSAIYADSILVDTLPPKGKVTINGGAAGTTTTKVTLSFSASGARYLQLSLDGGTVWGAWEPHAGIKKVTLPWSGPMGGKAKVMVRFRDYAGNTSVEYQDDIVMKVKGL